MFKSEFDRGVEIIHEVLHGLELFGCAYEDQEDVIYEPLPERDCPDEGFRNGFFVTAHEEVGIWWGSPTSWRKRLSMNERLLFFRMVSSNTPIVWGLGAPGGRVLACSFM